MNEIDNIYAAKCEYYKGLQMKYAEKHNDLNRIVQNSAFKKEYSVGGNNIHRGFNCPSPVIDLYTGNANRGHMINNIFESTYNYEYVYDHCGKIICVNHYQISKRNSILLSQEFIIDNGQSNYSLGFNCYGDNCTTPIISFISECIFQSNKIKEYYYVLCNLHYGGNGCSEIDHESYYYSNNHLISSTSLTYIFSLNRYSLYEYKYNLDVDGCVMSYMFIDRKIENGNNQWAEYPALVKRAL